MVLTGRRLLFLRRFWIHQLYHKREGDDDVISNNEDKPSYPKVILSPTTAHPLIESNSNGEVEIPHTPPPPTDRKHPLSSRKTRSTRKKSKNFTENEHELPHLPPHEDKEKKEPHTPPPPTDRKHPLSSRKTRSTMKKARSFVPEESQNTLDMLSSNFSDMDSFTLGVEILQEREISSGEESIKAIFGSISCLFSPQAQNEKQSPMGLQLHSPMGFHTPRIHHSAPRPRQHQHLQPVPAPAPLPLPQLSMMKKSVVKKRKMRKKETQKRFRRTNEEIRRGYSISQAREYRKMREKKQKSLFPILVGNLAEGM